MRLSEYFKLALALAVSTSSLAMAAESKTYEFDVQASGGEGLVCSVKKVPTGLPEEDTAFILVHIPANHTIKGAKLSSSKGSKDLQNPQVGGSVAKITVARTDVETLGQTVQLDLVVSTPAGGDQSVTCKNNGNTFALFGEKTPVAEENALDGVALKYLIENSDKLKKDLAKTHMEKLGIMKESRLIIHLPSGQLVSGTELEAGEGERLQVAFLLPANAEGLPSVHVDSCEEVDPFRTKKSETKEDKKQALKPTEYHLVLVGPVIRCGAGKLTYRVAPLSAYAGKKQADDTSTKKDAAQGDEDASNKFEFRIRPKYHLALSAMLGYDSAEQTRYEKQRDPMVAAAPTTIGEVKDQVGLAAYVGAVWMVGGVDYGDMKWTNYFLNIFIGVNPKSPTQDAVAGLAITPTGSLSLALGWSFHAGQRLKNGYISGATFTGDGDIPVESNWKRLSHGPFVGLSIDNNIYKALTDAFGSK